MPSDSYFGRFVLRKTGLDSGQDRVGSASVSFRKPIMNLYIICIGKWEVSDQNSDVRSDTNHRL